MTNAGNNYCIAFRKQPDELAWAILEWSVPIFQPTELWLKKIDCDSIVKTNSKHKAIQAVEQAIVTAFAGVTLDDGVGLMEGMEIDSYAGPEVRAAARKTDEKDDWSQIPVDKLNGAATSLSYFDAKGMRFHLPAYLIADLHGELTQDIRFHLNTRGLDERFSLLTTAQRQAVRMFLELQLEILPHPNLEFEGQTIRNSIDGYWQIDAS